MDNLGTAIDVTMVSLIAALQRDDYAAASAYAGVIEALHKLLTFRGY